MIRSAPIFKVMIMISYQMSISISLQAIPVPILDPFFLAIKRKAVVGAGIQVRDFMVGRGAEVDSCFRLKLAGLTCAVVTRLYVHHFKDSDLSQSEQNSFSADAWGSQAYVARTTPSRARGTDSGVPGIHLRRTPCGKNCCYDSM